MIPDGIECTVVLTFVDEDGDDTGNPVTFTVVQVNDDDITVRFEHPLAGKDIRFKVKILDVTDPKTPPPVPS